MAILTTVGLATGAALAAENFIFNYSKNEYVQKINVLESQVNALQEHIATMTELR